MNVTSFIQKCYHNDISLFLNEKGKLSYQSSRGRISKLIESILNLYNLELSEQLRIMENQITPFTGIKNKEYAKSGTDKTDTLEASKEWDNAENAAIEKNITKPSFPQVTLSFEVLVEEITRYRHVLEQTYIDPDNDGWHGDGLPEKFRSQDHTYEEMKKSLARFIGRVHQHEAEVDTAFLAFRSTRDALPEYQKYMKVLRVYNNSDPLSVEEVRLSWQSCLKTYENMPEHKTFMAAKKRQALFYPLTTRQPSQGHIQELVHSLG